MKKLILAIVAVAITGIVGTDVNADELVVKKGDTLWGYSQAYHVPVDKIKEWNGLTSDLIHPNDRFEVYPPNRYTVVKGDNLWDISRQQHVTVDEMKNWNKLTSDLILPGQALTIFAEAQAGVVKSAQLNEKPVHEMESIPAATNDHETESGPAPTQNSPEPVKAEEEKGEITMEATAYTASCEGCSGITKTGINLLENPDQKVIAVDPNVIPLGSKVYVEGYGEAIAGDTGGAIKGNRIDLFIPSKSDAIKWGRKTVKVKILD